MTEQTAEELTPALRRVLDSLDYGLLVSRLGPPESIDTNYADAQGYWIPGDGVPALIFDGPPDANAAGRCVANRDRSRYSKLPRIGHGDIHPSKCGWCDYPTEELLRSLDHATWRSQFVVSEFAVWHFGNQRYERTTNRAGEYDNPVWRAFYESDRGLRRHQITKAGAA